MGHPRGAAKCTLFTEDSHLGLTPETVGPCRLLLEGIVGEGVELTTAVLEAVRPSETRRG
jgi:type III restriction enzyme